MSLTTHVLDTTRGAGAAGMVVEVLRIGGEETGRAVLDADGRGTLLHELAKGTYLMLFQAGDYLRADDSTATTDFYDVIPVRFNVSNPGRHHHIPLILSRFGYSTYRGG